MGKNRKRKRERDKPKAEGIPVSKLGSEFEWIDERLRIGLEAYPTFKRPLGKAEINMMLALNMYYDEISGKWQPLDSLDISTVKNLARFYLLEPPELTADIFENMRINKNHKLMTYDSAVLKSNESLIISGSLTSGQHFLIDVLAEGYAWGSASIFAYNIVGTMQFIKISHKLPHDEYISEYDSGQFLTDLKFYSNFAIPSRTLTVFVYALAGATCDYYIEIHKCTDSQCY